MDTGLSSTHATLTHKTKGNHNIFFSYSPLPSLTCSPVPFSPSPRYFQYSAVTQMCHSLSIGDRFARKRACYQKVISERCFSFFAEGLIQPRLPLGMLTPPGTHLPTAKLKVLIHEPCRLYGWGSRADQAWCQTDRLPWMAAWTVKMARSIGFNLFVPNTTCNIPNVWAVSASQWVPAV